MSICAYCRKEGQLTREHIVPSFLYAFQKQLESSVIGWNEVAGKMVPGEFKVKDVCASCNNDVLGKLDGAAKILLEEAGILTPNYTRKSLTLRYEYDALVRWLLKVSYNSSRTDGAHSHLFVDLIPYMLGTSKRPPRFRVAILSYLAAPERMSPERLDAIPYLNGMSSTDPFNPFFVRIGYGAVADSSSYTLRLNIFGPLVFFMLLFDDRVLPGHAAAEIRRFTKSVEGAVELTPGCKVKELVSGKLTWADLYEVQIARVKALSDR